MFVPISRTSNRMIALPPPWPAPASPPADPPFRPATARSRTAQHGRRQTSRFRPSPAWTALRASYLDRMKKLKDPAARVRFLVKNARGIRTLIKRLTKPGRRAEQIRLAVQAAALAVAGWPGRLNTEKTKGLSCVDQATHVAWLTSRLLGLRWRHLEKVPNSRPARYRNIGTRFGHSSHWGWFGRSNRRNVKVVQTVRATERIDFGRVRPGDLIIWELKRPPHGAWAHAATVLHKDTDVLVTVEGHIASPTEICAYWINPSAEPGDDGTRVETEVGTFSLTTGDRFRGFAHFATRRMYVVRRRNYE